MAGIPAAQIDRLLIDERLASDAVDCPIRYEIWREYALWGPSHRAAILLERNPRVPLAEDQLADLLRFSGVDRSRPESSGYTVTVRGVGDGGEGRDLVTARGDDGGVEQELPLLFGGWVLVEPTLHQLVALLPLTSWGPIARRLAGADADSLEALRQLALGTTPSPTDRPSTGSARIDRQCSWLVRVLARLWGYDLDFPGERDRAQGDVARLLGQLREVWGLDGEPPEARPVGSHEILSMNLNRPVVPAVATSRRTVKADAATRVFDVSCSSITWAVLDSGIDATHESFKGADGVSRIRNTVDLTRISQSDLREIFALSGHELVEAIDARAMDPTSADYHRPIGDHGTHVAGILGSAPFETPDATVWGVCPDINLWDIRVLGPDEQGSEDRVLMALQYIRERNALAGPRMEVAGVNMSLSIPYNPANHACGWTPVCNEARRLVRSGVVVVAAAGNAGFIDPKGARTVGTGYSVMGITDPGNAEDVITVGATGRDRPLTFGVSFFSSKGPTADGRMKPDLLAPGQAIVSTSTDGSTSSKNGTSQAAPHVSGAAALLMARNPELIGQPDLIKQVLCNTATDLGRVRTFQGAGLLDVLRALESV